MGLRATESQTRARALTLLLPSCMTLGKSSCLTMPRALPPANEDDGLHQSGSVDDPRGPLGDTERCLPCSKG